ncbi:MAG: FadR family transcriptional regulator [Pseudomonadota bacterium]|jgi:GntR family uxuAB operon transcriptional repressor|uniref:FadR/GntR family transcriptional regulator n=1 Tax=Burkholderia sp. PAMC 28687 TaxID=1795874 RepID=UPI000780CAEE|nr:FadR/GntR family transcriptional regulator [Burkholderia sp. PAMC 28687]AMM16303.1 GntR family transcriptional regulator [Burkholderia sp. PAMC 28687]MDP9152972.1 FadR family transcriptional regulator [Pseudomonadota bacterium]
MDLPNLKAERLYQKISTLLTGLIKDGTFAQGVALPAERELAKQLGVGRSSVREALIALEIAGWVEIRTGTGVFVRQPDATRAEPAAADAEFSAADLLAARAVIEGEIAALAAKNGTDVQREALTRNINMLEAQSVNNAAFLDEDKRFHLLISEMTGNAVLTEVMTVLWNKRYSPMFTHLETFYADKHIPAAMNADHRKIGEAILNRDARAAKNAMRAHLRHVHHKLFADSPDGDAA